MLFSESYLINNSSIKGVLQNLLWLSSYCRNDCFCNNNFEEFLGNFQVLVSEFGLFVLGINAYQTIVYAEFTIV